MDATITTANPMLDSTESTNPCENSVEALALELNSLHVTTTETANNDEGGSDERPPAHDQKSCLRVRLPRLQSLRFRQCCGRLWEASILIGVLLIMIVLFALHCTNLASSLTNLASSSNSAVDVKSLIGATKGIETIVWVLSLLVCLSIGYSLIQITCRRDQRVQGYRNKVGKGYDTAGGRLCVSYRCVRYYTGGVPKIRMGSRYCLREWSWGGFSGRSSLLKCPNVATSQRSWWYI